MADEIKLEGIEKKSTPPRRVVIISTNGSDVKIDKQEVSNLELHMIALYIKKLFEER